MSETPERSRLAKIALAAWCNVPVDQLGPEKVWIEHPNDLNRQAWDRVVAAISAEVEPKLQAVARALTECAGDLEAEIMARAGGELPRRIDRDLGTVRRARETLSLLRGEGATDV